MSATLQGSLMLDTSQCMRCALARSCHLRQRQRVLSSPSSLRRWIVLYALVMSGCLDFGAHAKSDDHAKGDAGGATTGENNGGENDTTSGQNGSDDPMDGAVHDSGSDDSGLTDSGANAAIDSGEPDAQVVECPAPQSDDFSGAFNTTRWQTTGDAAELDTPRTEGGKLLVVPNNGGWFNTSQGHFLHQSVCDNFLVEAFAEAESRAGGAIPSLPFSVAGLMARDPNAERRWMMIAAGTLYSATGIEAKWTNSAPTTRYDVSSGVTSARMRLCRVANTIVALYWTGSAWRSTTAGNASLSYDFSAVSPLPRIMHVGLASSPWGTQTGTYYMAGDPDLRSSFDDLIFHPAPTTLADCAK